MRYPSSTVPLLQAGECQVWRARPAAAGDDLLELLDEDEQQRWSRFLRERDRALFLTAHALARIVLARQLGLDPRTLRFTRICRHCGGAHGKPRVSGAEGGLDFSLSHSGERVIVAVTRDAALGVDVEQLEAGRDRTTLIPAVLAESEQQVVAALPPPERNAALLRYWTRKEALLKATEHGLAVALRDVRVSAPAEPAALIAWMAAPKLEMPAWLADLDAGPGHVACLAMLGARLDVVERDGDQYLSPTQRPPR